MARLEPGFVTQGVIDIYAEMSKKGERYSDFNNIFFGILLPTVIALDLLTFPLSLTNAYVNYLLEPSPKVPQNKSS